MDTCDGCLYYDTCIRYTINVRCAMYAPSKFSEIEQKQGTKECVKRGESDNKMSVGKRVYRNFKDFNK